MPLKPSIMERCPKCFSRQVRYDGHWVHINKCPCNLPPRLQIPPRRVFRNEIIIMKRGETFEEASMRESGVR